MADTARHRLSTRVIHWSTAVSFFVALLSGLPIWTPIFGWMAHLFGGLQVCRWLHPWSGIVFFVAVGAMTYVAYKVTAVLVGGHRVAPEVEELGLDLPEMGALAYPDTPEVASAVILSEPADVSLGSGLEPEPEAA